MANRLSSENAEQAGRVVTRADNNPPSLVALLLDEMSERFRDEWAKVEPIRAEANALDQKIDSDEMLGKWTAVYTKARELHRSLDEARKAEKRPFADAIEEEFGKRLSPLERITTWVKKAADDFNRAKLQKQRALEQAERERLAQVERQKREEARILATLEDDSAADAAVAAIEAGQQAAAVETSTTADATRVAVDGGGMASGKQVWKFTVEDYTKVDLNALRHLIPTAAVDKAIAAVVKAQKGATKIEGVKVYEDVATSFRK